MITAPTLVACAQACGDTLHDHTARKYIKGHRVSESYALICDRAMSKFIREAIKMKRSRYNSYLSPRAKKA